MTKLSDFYRTPSEVFDPINEVTPIFWDAACNKDNCLVPIQIDLLDIDFPSYDYLKTDMLDTQNNLINSSGIFEGCRELDREIYNSTVKAEIGDTIFINPPYSKKTKDHPGVEGFIRKAWEDAKHFRVVLLLKADMSTDWFNNILKESDFFSVQINQQDMSLYLSYQEVLGRMDDAYTKSDIGILHLRKRVKFLADEEMMEADRLANSIGIYQELQLDLGSRVTVVGPLLETKNFKRGADGLIYPKSGPTFPSMLVVLDRRGV